MSEPNNVPPSPVAGSSAEAQAAAFATDPRIHYDRTSGTWRFEDDDGNEHEYDNTKGAWVAVVSTEYTRLRAPALTRWFECGMFVLLGG